MPPLPVRDEIEHELDAILTAKMTHTERAMIAFLWGARRQIFWDGNKRTSLLLANKILLEHSNGMMTIREKDMPKFNQLLSAYYTTNDMRDMKSFLYHHAIDGISF